MAVRVKAVPNYVKSLALRNIMIPLLFGSKLLYWCYVMWVLLDCMKKLCRSVLDNFLNDT